MNEDEREYDFEKFRISLLDARETARMNATVAVYQTAFALLTALMAFAVAFWAATGTLSTSTGIDGVIVLLVVVVLGYYLANYAIGRRLAKGERATKLLLDELKNKFLKKK